MELAEKLVEFIFSNLLLHFYINFYLFKNRFYNLCFIYILRGKSKVWWERTKEFHSWTKALLFFGIIIF